MKIARLAGCTSVVGVFVPASPSGWRSPASSGPLGCVQRLYMHDCLRMPWPPNLGLSTQLMQRPAVRTRAMA